MDGRHGFLTEEQQRADELKAAGLRRSSFDGRIEKIPEPDKPQTQAEIDAGWQAIREQARVNTAEREAQEAAQRAEQGRLWAESEAQKAAAWERYTVLAGRSLEGGTLANRALFETEWARHLAQRAIAESLAPATG